jgi:cytochrome c biogenesis protein CcdA
VGFVALELLIGSSIVTAFVAGMAALFAPCCITVLLPAYLGSIFKEKRTVLVMTFVFFLGLLAVFMPLGLGAAALGQFFSQYHNAIYVAGGLFLLLLSASILSGRHFSLPFSVHSSGGAQKVRNAGSVFGLGVFSGFATLCCAPVLAGALALSVLPGSIFWGGLYTLTYVLGMVVPLFVLAYFLDRADFTKRLMALRRRVSYSLAGRKISLSLADVLSGAIFLLMGSLILYLAFSDQLAMGGGGYQTDMNIYVSNLASALGQYVGGLPPAVFAMAPLLALLLIGRAVYARWKRPVSETVKP